MIRGHTPPTRWAPTRRLLLAGGLSAAAVPAAKAQELPPPLSLYGQLPAISKVAISPDGRRVALIRHKGALMWLEDRDLATGEGVSVAISGNMVPYLIWANNERFFVVTSMTTKAVGTSYEAWIGMIVDVRQHRHYQLFGETPEYGPNLNGDFHRVKMRRGYCITASNSHRTSNNYPVTYATSLFAFSAVHFQPDRLDEDGRLILNWAVCGDGRPVARAEYDVDSRVWQLRFRGRRGWRIIHSVTGDIDLPLLKGMGRTSDKVLLYFNSGELRDAYVEVGEDGVYSPPLAKNRAKVAPVYDPVSGLLVAFSDEDGLAHCVWLDPVRRDLAAGLEQMALQPLCEQIDLAEDPRQCVLYGEGPRYAGGYFAVDQGTQRVVKLGDTYPDLPQTWVFPKQPISYAASDGLMIDAYLTRPDSSWGPRPALIVLPHGGPESFDDGRFDYVAQALASRGYQVLQANFRGSSHRGRDFVARGYGEWGRRMQTDLSDGVAWLLDQGLADGKRVAIAGSSYGGYAALAGVSLQSGIYACAVSIAGISDIDRYMEALLEDARANNHARTLTYWRQFLGPQDQWRAVSPVAHAADITVPVLLIHARDDAVVRFEQALAMQKAMTESGRAVDLVLLEAGDHYLSQEATRIQALEVMVDFLVRHLPPGQA